VFIFIPFTGQPHVQLLQHAAPVKGQRVFLKTGTFQSIFTVNRKKILSDIIKLGIRKSPSLLSANVSTFLPTTKSRICLYLLYLTQSKFMERKAGIICFDL